MMGIFWFCTNLQSEPRAGVADPNLYAESGSENYVFGRLNRAQ